MDVQDIDTPREGWGEELAEDFTGVHEKSFLMELLQSLFQDKAAFLGAITLTAMILVAILAPHLAPYDPMAQNLAHSLRPPLWKSPEGTIYLLGTDPVGRDVLSRIIYGTRISLSIGFVAVLISLFFGLFMGLLSGYLGGKVDFVIMRVVDFVLSFPFILIALSFIAIMGPSIPLLCLVMSSRIWIVYARLVRSQTLQLRELEFVHAAQAIGAGNSRIIWRHILPNVLAPCIVIASLYLGRMIIIESGLSFLGLGVPPPSISWGGMLAEGRAYIFGSWWIITFPGLAILMAALSAQLLGDWLTVWLDPRLREVS